jgi:N-dimethylarginine dimethylaminohydrolase
MLAITRRPSPLLESGERTHIGRAPIDLARALAQHDAYRAALTSCGLEGQRLDDADADAFPDGVFIEDTAIAGSFGYTVSAVGMHGCLHLKSGCTALPDGRLLVNRAWIETSDLAGFGLVDVPSAEPWGRDVAIANETVIAAAGYDETLALIEREGFQIKAVDLSEFAKAEGGVTCLSLIFGVTP